MRTLGKSPRARFSRMSRAIIRKRLKDMKRMNRAADLGRVPETAARILPKLDA